MNRVLHGAQLGVADLQAEGLLGDSEEWAALIGERDLEFADAGARGGELLLAEEFLHGEGGVLCGVHEGDIGASVALDGGAEERVVRAAEDEGVHAGAQQFFQVAGGDGVGDGVVEPAFLDERDEERAGLGEDFHPGVEGLDGAFVGAAGDGGAERMALSFVVRSGHHHTRISIGFRSVRT